MARSSESGAPLGRIGAALRVERTRAGVSLSAIAQQAGIAKSTLSQLESGNGNPSVETLWAIAHALGIPVSRLVDPPVAKPTLIRAGEGIGLASDHAHYRATLLSSCPPSARRDMYLVDAEPGAAKDSDPHPPRTTEHVLLYSGRALVGPIEEPIELYAGDYLAYPADVAHTFRALHKGTRAVLLSEYV